MLVGNMLPVIVDFRWKLPLLRKYGGGTIKVKPTFFNLFNLVYHPPYSQ